MGGLGFEVAPPSLPAAPSTLLPAPVSSGEPSVSSAPAKMLRLRILVSGTKLQFRSSDCFEIGSGQMIGFVGRIK